MIHDKDCCQGREGVDNPADEAVASQDARKPSQKYDADIHRQSLFAELDGAAFFTSSIPR